MHYRQNIEGCFAGGGVTERDYKNVLSETEEGLGWLRGQSKTGGLPLLELPGRSDDLPNLEAIATQFRERCTHVLVLGVGGSNLGGRALVALVDQHEADSTVLFLDSIDPDTIARLERALDWGSAGLLVISKSGMTLETLSQFITLAPKFIGAVGAREFSRRAIVITEPGKTPLRRLAAQFNLPVLDHDPGIAGRFSALSLVGLLPALISGIDARAVRAGASDVLAECLNARTPMRSEPAVGAALSVALQRHAGIITSVLMTYYMRLGAFSSWFRQLWAESLGKSGHGITPVRFQGTRDQHSQLQLYLDGPDDKMFTLIFGDIAGHGALMAPDLAVAAQLDYLSNHTMGDLLDAERRATVDTLVRNERPVRLIHVPRLDDAAMGALMMHFILETIIAARLMGIDAFTQPAVEEGKRLAHKYLADMKRKRGP